MMIVMRQRLLLVAGWLAAAIGTGLVASGAVAVAGGQVLDRPLRPLTAAEVAELPVVAVGSSENVEHQASGGIGQSTDEPTVGSAGSDTDPDTDATGSASTGGSVDDEPDQSARWDRFTNPGSSETKVVSLHAGKASFALADDRLHLLWATPGAGYVMNTLSREDTAIIISFSSSRDVWLIEARIVDGSLEVVSGPTPFA